MSESERRRKSPLTRVLIESERILSPQFDDAILFLKGAQIEMLRNVTQYLNRISTYVSEYGLGYYLTPTAEDYDSILAIVADLEETLMGNQNVIWGYKERYYELVDFTSSGAPTSYIHSDAVPAGSLAIVEHWTIGHWGGTTLDVTLSIVEGAYYPMLYAAPAVPHGDLVYQTTHLTLKEGDRLELKIVGLPNGTTAVLIIWGYTMVVPEE